MSVGLTDVISDDIVVRLKGQLKAEFESSQVYRAYSEWAKQKGHDGAAMWYRMQSDEELVHASQIQDHLRAIPGLLNEIPACESVAIPSLDLSLKDILEMSLERERTLSQMVVGTMKLAEDLQDYYTQNLMSDFIKEQVEEEKLFKDVLRQLASALADNKSVDEYLGKRVK